MPEKKNVLTEIFCLVSTVFFIWVWSGNPVLSVYNLQLTAFLVIVYFVMRFIVGNKDNTLRTNLLADTAIFTSLLLLVLSTSGGLESSLFFLTYFVLFATSLLFETPVTVTLTISIILFFAREITSFDAALKIISLIFMAPLAMYFGNKYLRLLESKEKIKILFKTKRGLAIENKGLSLIVEKTETNALLWLTLDFKDNLLKIVHHSAELLSDLGHLTIYQKEHLEKIHDNAKELLRSGEKLEKEIDKQTD